MSKIKVKADIPNEIHKQLEAYPEFVRKLLFYRNITDAKSAEAFLNPDYAPHDPFLMKGMKKAVERLLLAIKNNERVTIFSDYDADGIPGAVVMHDFLKKIGYKNFDVYIPNRHSEGFGLNNEAVKEIAGRGTKLMITVDCGIADAKEVKLASSLGIETIVTDHHTPTDGIPKATAVIDPKQKGCKYPDKNLCGAAVAFKFVEAMINVLTGSPSPELGTIFNAVTLKIGWEKWLLDMVGIATLSDMVPLVGENRMFARYGLAVLRKSPRPGLLALFSALRINRRTLSEDDIVFSISPRLNAASRMGDPMDAFKLLTTDDEIEAIRLAKSLESLNNERKGVVAGIIKEIKHKAKERNLSEKKVIVIGNPVWKPSLLGLAAGTIAEEFGKPVFLWGRDTDTILKGSCRGGGGINVLELMEKAGNIFLEYGGHAGAGGFSVSFDEVHRLESDLEKAVKECSVVVEDENNGIADTILRLAELDWNMITHLEKLSPFGASNPKPLFLIEKAIVNEVRRFGKNNIHTALRFEKGDAETIEAISFFTTPRDWDRPVDVGKEISLLAHIEQSHYRASPEIRLRIVDIL